MKRTIVVGQACKINVVNDQLICTTEESTALSCPIEDLGMLLLETPQLVITGAALSRLCESKVAVISCSANHHPNGIFLPIAGGSTHTEVLRRQVDAGQPLRKQLWKKTVKAKLDNQAEIASRWGLDCDPIYRWSSKVRSGDPDNYEARAAAWYWKNYLGKERKFKRDPEGDAPNTFLNYGYAILRAAMARAIVSTGLHPSIGIHHRNRYNAFCLADDLMEPYRPCIDAIVRDLYLDRSIDVLGKEAKSELLNVLVQDVHIGGNNRPLQHALSVTTSSLASCYETKKADIQFPILHAV